ncbi:peptidase [Neisseria arctica]|uniref:Peptidase n=1 Tax=Neisseria arctica TaxID=1470200 RepID=A0A0J0YR31_9NEIS|nr:ClpXP protease specificity-enhancing factor [Neisseria arctica]KLT72611.1 peptidase [Neisseria arctica]UOO86309.1 ClpXP protease specificity-enhancing factor [Neisseria arctica]
MTTSTKPYLLRALYEWCMDNNYTPHIVAWVNEHTRVPMQYVRDNEIVLNIGASACHNLVIDNEWVSFSARFGGVAHEIWIPVGHVISFFSRENGEGLGFELEPYEPQRKETIHVEEETAEAVEDGSTDKKAKAKKGLRLVK